MHQNIIHDSASALGLCYQTVPGRLKNPHFKDFVDGHKDWKGFLESYLGRGTEHLWISLV